MPSIQLPLVSYEELVSEPIKKQILKLIDKDINYVNSAGNKLTISDGISLSNEEESRVIINETDYGDSGLSNNVTAANNRHCIILDKDIGLYAKFADVSKQFIINVSRRFATRGEAMWWKNSMLGNIRDSTSNTTVDVAISPCIPNKVLTVMEACRKLKAVRDDTTPDIMGYLREISMDTLTIDTNRIKSALAIMYPELLSNLVFSLPTEELTPEYRDGKYTIDFDITTIIKVPVAVVLTYPNFVGGLQMPKSMLSITSNNNTDANYRSDGTVLADLISFTGRQVSHYRRYCYQLPSFESYFFPFSKWGLSPIFQIRIGVEKTDKRLIVNLNDLFVGPIGGYQLDPLLLEYLVANRERISTTSEVAVGVVLMKGKDRVIREQLYIDDHMNLRSTYDLDLLGDYHLVLTTPLQTATISENVLETLADMPVLLNRLIKHTNTMVTYSALPDTPVATTEIYRPVFDEILQLKYITSALTANVLVVKTT